MRIKTGFVLTGIIAILLALQSMFVITPVNRGLVIYLGDLKHSDNNEALVYDPGLHFKLPVVERVLKVDHRLQSFDIPSTRVLTSDQKFVNVDYYVKWRVTNPAVFYKATGANFAVAKDLLKSKSIDALRAEFGVREWTEIISGDERTQMVINMREQANLSSENMGVEVIDVRLKRVDYPQDVTLSVYERMRSSREREAKKYRATGVAKSEEIKSSADKEALVIVADAQKQAAERVALANAVAAEIFSAAYRNAPNFYRFYLKMNGYQDSISGNDIFVVDPSQSEYFKDLSTNGEG